MTTCVKTGCMFVFCDSDGYPMEQSWGDLHYVGDATAVCHWTHREPYDEAACKGLLTVRVNVTRALELQRTHVSVIERRWIPLEDKVKAEMAGGWPVGH